MNRVTEYLEWNRRWKKAIHDPNSLDDDACCKDRMEGLWQQMTPEEREKIDEFTQRTNPPYRT